jgi:hypothetical protein
VGDGRKQMAEQLHFKGRIGDEVVGDSIIKSTITLIHRATLGCAALVLPLSLASCKAGNPNQAQNENPDRISKLELGAISMRENLALDKNSLRQVESNELLELLTNSQMTTISTNRKVLGPKYEAFNKNGNWSMVSESKRLRAYSGKWRVEGVFYIVSNIKELNYPEHSIKNVKRKMYTDTNGNYFSHAPVPGLEIDLRLMDISRQSR